MTKPPLRCAIYTRKSSEEGLDQAFNTLQAQREACEAYIRSQVGEGWVSLAERYDDGGFSGGTMQRPALQRLMTDVGARKIDVVLVYKVDRLTRFLPDFARIVEAFDKTDVSFVSVTQAFNTTTSMGRLTLNMLLSFAQFEREITSERIRDKIAASKAKGMWMGGLPPLGYNVPNDGSRNLAVNVREAAQVRLMFAKLLELGSLPALQRWLASEGLRSKRRVFAGGRIFGDCSFTRGALRHVMSNRIYLGQIVHKGVIHAGVVRDFVNQYKKSSDPNYCVRVTANDGEIGEQFLREFQDNEKIIPTILTTSQKLSTGVDARNIRNIVLMRPVNSMIEFKQIVGRGTRLYDGKEFFTIYDFVNACHHFADPEWDGEPEPETVSRIKSLAQEPYDLTEPREPKENDDNRRNKKIKEHKF